MDDDRILESERLQMEQIRELEMEDLEIEEVDEAHLSSSSGDDFIGRGNDGGAGGYGGFTFDTCLASLHTYLGEVDDTHNRKSFLDGGAILNLPMFYLEGVVLFPEATLPLRVIQPRFKAAVERALSQADAPNTIALICELGTGSRFASIGVPGDGRLQFAKVGTTAEIRQYRRLEDGSFNVLTRGQQRFHLRRRWIDVEGAPCAEIQIIQEDLPLRTPRDAFAQLASVPSISSHNFLRGVPSVAPRARSSMHEVENDMESMFEASSENDISPRIRMDRHAPNSFSFYDRIDDSTSSDDDQIVSQSGQQPGISSSGDSEGSSQHSFDEGNKGTDAVLGVKNTSLIERESQNCNGWKKQWGMLESKRIRRAPRSFWPYWVYRMYDSYQLAQKAAVMWRFIVGAPSMDDLVGKPDLLSFYVASKIPVSESVRQELLEIDGISYRLRREIELLECFDSVRCKTCQSLIAKRSDMLVMSSDGPLGAYVNPHGYVHEIMTFHKVNGVALIGRPDEKYSWFPGYAWTIATCATCEYQLGWLFTARNKKLRPKSFWAIRSSQVADDIR
ncbi:hypothetical protein Sjap_019570 [Stephania japonica]|uniref:Protein cereblon n=1 Tax=Stephania japonica TaxID=461633 RepID=A0AAP0HZH0_9MAGN